MFVLAAAAAGLAAVRWLAGCPLLLRCSSSVGFRGADTFWLEQIPGADECRGAGAGPSAARVAWRIYLREIKPVQAGGGRNVPDNCPGLRQERAPGGRPGGRAVWRRARRYGLL